MNYNGFGMDTRKILVSLLTLLLPGLLRAQDKIYDASLIPSALKSYANAIVRNQEVTVEVKGLNNVDFRFKEAITILNENGKSLGSIDVDYDKFQQIKDLKAAVYDASGNLIKKLKSGDFEDRSAVPDFSLFQDDRVKHLLPVANNYPYTIEYEYGKKIKQTFYFLPWYPQEAPDIALEKSTYRFIAPNDFPLRVKEFNLEKDSRQPYGKDQVVYEWHADHLTAQRDEPLSPPLEDFLPMVKIAPVKFEYDGIRGEFSNWREYGKWVYDNLLDGRNKLSPATISIVQELVKNISSPEEKARRIYAYMQQRTRYISVQIGIGGFQPMKAEDVDRLGYGDCKGLVNYTMALLEAAGIPAYYTEVNAGKDKRSFLPGFASAIQGNHIILCVPFGKDTTWLECTDKDIPFGYIGEFTDDRNVLICTPRGGIFTRTPGYPDSLNSEQVHAQFVIDTAGNLSGSMETTFTGTRYEDRAAVEQLSGKDKMEKLQDIYPFNNLEVTGYRLLHDKTARPATIEKMELQSPRYGTLNDGRMYLPINMVNRTAPPPPYVRNRKNKLNIARGSYDRDSIIYRLPKGFIIERIPEEVSLRNEFGAYTAKTREEDGRLIFTREFLLRAGEYAPETYDRLIDFLKQAGAADHDQIVLLRK